MWNKHINDIISSGILTVRFNKNLRFKKCVIFFKVILSVGSKDQGSSLQEFLSC